MDYKASLDYIEKSTAARQELLSKAAYLEQSIQETLKKIQLDFDSKFMFSVLKHISNRKAVLSTIEVPRALGATKTLRDLNVSEVLVLHDEMKDHNGKTGDIYRAIRGGDMDRIALIFRGIEVTAHTIVLDTLIATKYVGAHNFKNARDLHDEMEKVRRCGNSAHIPLNIVMISSLSANK